MSTLFSMDALHQAREVVGAVMSPTPQYRWPLLEERSGVEVWVKHENHTPTGAFKVRGGLVYMDHLHRQNALPSGFITATRGNHGQSIPFAASRYGVPVTVYVPEGNSVEKNRAMQAWGGGGLTDVSILPELWAWARILRLADGPDEVHKAQIARLEIGKHIAKK